MMKRSALVTGCAAAGAALFIAACRHGAAELPPPAVRGEAEEEPISSEQASILQRQLRALDIPVEVTGEWDAQTQAGLVQYQERHGLKPTGRLDADTRRLLSLAPPGVGGPDDDPVRTRVPDEERLRLAPPEHADPQRDPAQNLPEIPSNPSGATTGTPTTRPNKQDYPGAFQACVDRELTRRGLNAFGDYPGTPARDVEDRYAYVIDRYPDIATSCGTSAW